ncbi:MAG: carbohydrate porin [Acidobacteriota bacterium]|nr:carbohydrate porin [Acidobacteriota bacterium]
MKSSALVLSLVCISGTLAAQAPADEAWSLHGQTTFVVQGHGAFDSPYSGFYSFQSRKETRSSFTSTFFAGWRPWQGGELYVNPELSAGTGVSQVLGLAGAPNGEIYRVDSPKLALSLARLFLRQTWSLGGADSSVPPDQNQLASRASSRRIVLTAGRFSTMDVFDVNAYAHDPRTQFLNWALMGSAAWDYPADTRGYTWGLAVEFYWDAWALRLGSFLEPKEANQLDFDHQVSRAHGDVLELERDHQVGGLDGKVRILGFANHARMGDYRVALAALPPDVAATRSPGRTKYGWALNVEQAISGDLGAFARYSWNDGATETWAFTEIDRSFASGFQVTGKGWGRKSDKFSLAFVSNGLSKAHADYLRGGGSGFLLGDGRLNEGSERILEAVYNAQIASFFSLSLDAQRFWNPAYNRDRGPLNIFSVRLHASF